VTRLIAKDFFAGTFTDAHFGANILSTRDRLGENGTYDEAVDYLGVGTIRYPGGSLTERYFDITDPDQSLTQHHLTGADQPLLPFSEFMEFAESTGRSVLIVLPTATQLGTTRDSSGNRFEAIDEAALRDFVRDTLDGLYGSPRIAGFEIGNEYWDSGQMTSVEYGRVASAMAWIVDDEINNHPYFEARFAETKIHVQMGSENGYAGLSERYTGTAQEQLDQFSREFGLELKGDYIQSNGKISWPKIANLLVIREFDLPEERAAVDGVVAHVYSRGETEISSHSFELRTIAKTWAEEFPDAKPVVTEWNVRAPGRDAQTEFGLVQAAEMLDLVEAFGLYEVSAAYVWAVQQGSQSNLAGDEGSPAMKVGGAFFNMMSETLPGTRAIVLDGAGRRESEIALENAEVHSFAGPEKLVLYLQSTNTDATADTTIDLAGLITGFDSITMTKLGVMPGDAVGSSTATPVLTELDPADHYDNGILSVTLSPREIVQVTMQGVDFTPALSDLLARADLEEFGAPMDMIAMASADDTFWSASPDDTFWLPGSLEAQGMAAQEAEKAVQVAEDEAATDSDTDAENAGGFMSEMLMLGLLLPLVMMFAAF
jgi:hypothetical protein